MLVLSSVAFAQNAPTLTADVTLSQDISDVYDVTLSIKNADFNIFQLALRYDTKKAMPFDAQGQKDAQEFDEFATLSKIDGLNIIGKTLDIQNGVFGFTGYVSPGQEKTDFVDENGVVTAREGIALATFRFKSLDGKAPVIEVAVDDGKAHQKSFPQGLAFVCMDETYKQVNFVCNAGGMTNSYNVEYKPTFPMTKQKRLENTVYLQAYNYAFAHDGVLEIIDSDNKSIAPQIVDGKMFVPLRCIAKAFDCEISWNEKDKIVSLVSGHGFSAALQIGNINAMANDESINLESAPYIYDGRTFVCVGDLEDIILNAKVWNGQSLDVVITTSEKWQQDRQAEKEALNAMMLVVSPFVKIFG